MWCRLVLTFCLGYVYANEYSHKYIVDEDVTLWVNKVGPYHNPQETYVYYSLPFCSTKPIDQLEHRWDGLGEVLEGNDLVNSGIPFRYREPTKEYTKVCTVKLDESRIKQLAYAVRNHYWYQFYLDDLPIWGMVGELSAREAVDGGTETSDSDEQTEALVYTHKRFVIAYNGDRIIQVNLTSENPVTLSYGTQLEFSYSVEWVSSTIPFHRRFDRYLDYDFFEHQIHWFSIFNSFMMVIFLTGIVALILVRTLRKDFAKYSRETADLDDLENELDESGWKQVHGDVFRPPNQLTLFCALVGTGSQLAIMVFSMILFATLTTLYVGRGAIVVSFLIAYSATALFGGYASGALFSRMGGRTWIRTMLYTACLFPGPCFVCTTVLNVVAMFYRSLASIPFASILSVVLIWSLIALPLTVLGTILGRNWAGAPNDPCRVNAIPRLVPDKRWYARPPVLVALGGILPFGSIFIEMYFVFTSFWNYKFYYVYGFMLSVFIILTIVTVCVTIVVTYFLLNNEDYRWPWTSFAASASTAGYVFLYSLYYFFMKTKMSGFFQTVFYFAYMGLFCLALGIMCGTLGFTGCSIFVHRIYRNIKSD